MAFRNLGIFGKAAVVGTCAAAVGAFVGIRQVPFFNDFYKVWTDRNDVPAWFQDKMVSRYNEMQQQENNNSLLKKHLPQKLFNDLKSIKTRRGTTLMHCIQSGFDNPDSPIGVYAAEYDSYDDFSPLFDPIINELHGGVKKQPASDWGQKHLNYFENLDADGHYVKSVEIQCIRNVKGFLFHPLTELEDYYILEKRFRNVFDQIDESDLKGKFVSLKSLNAEDQRNLDKLNVSFKNNDKYLQSAKAYHHWPVGRAVFYSVGDDGKNVAALINGEDHLKLIASSTGGDVKSTLNKLTRLLNQIESNTDGMRLKFARHDRLGYVTFSPANLGNGVTASAEVKLSSLSSSEKDFRETCDKLNLSVKNKGSGVFLVSNKQKFGITEFEAVKQMYDGVKQLIEMEKGGGGVSDKKK